MSQRQQIVPWLLGFFLIANVYLVPALAQTPRATDALGVVLGLWLLWRFCTRGLHAGPLGLLLLFGAIPLVWGLYASSTGDVQTTLLSSRWLLAIPWGYVLFTTTQDERQRSSLVWGMLLGCLGSLVVQALQFYGLVELTQNLGLAAQDFTLSYVGTTLRSAGLEEHPNAGAAISSLAVPLSLYLYYAYRTHILVVALGIGVMLAGMQFTETRSVGLVSLVTVLSVFFANVLVSKTWRSLRLAALLMYVGLPILLLLGPPSGWDRWLDYQDIETNSGERLLSNVRALQISLEHPLGLGVETGQQMMLQDYTQIGATHNAFLQAALVYGLLFAVALFSLLIVLASRAFLGPRAFLALEAMLGLQTFGLFFWEEHLAAPTFVILVNWFIAACGSLAGSYLQTTQAHLRHAGRLHRGDRGSYGVRYSSPVPRPGYLFKRDAVPEDER